MLDNHNKLCREQQQLHRETQERSEWSTMKSGSYVYVVEGLEIEEPEELIGVKWKQLREIAGRGERGDW